MYLTMILILLMLIYTGDFHCSKAYLFNFKLACSSLQGWGHNVDGHLAKAVSASAVFKTVRKGLDCKSTKAGVSASPPS